MTRRIGVGELYLTRSGPSSKLYRVVVTAIKENGYTLRYIDYGHEGEVRRAEDLLGVPDRICRLYPAVVGLRPAERLERAVVESEVMGRRVTAVLRAEKRGDGLVEELTHFYYNGQEILGGGVKEKVFLPSKYPEMEILRDRGTVATPDLTLRDDLEREKQKRTVEESSFCSTSPLKPVGEVLVIRPKLVSKVKRPVTESSVPSAQFKTSPVTSKPKSWAIGDKVSAFCCGDNSWKPGVIHELDNNSALVVFSEEDVRSSFIDFSLLKSGSVSSDVLDQVEQEVTNISRDLGKKLVTEEDYSHQDKVVSSVISPGQVMDCLTADFCRFARTGAGSRVLQTYVAPNNRKLCQKMVEHILNSDVGVVKMMTNAKSCFLLRKIFENLYMIPEAQRDQLTSIVLENFSHLSLDSHGYHVVSMAVTKLGLKTTSWYAKLLENKSHLFQLLKNPHGTFVVQTMCSNMPKSTVTFMVNTLLGHVVELSNNQHASFFIQKFLQHWGQSSALDFVVENILKHQRELVHNSRGVHTIQMLLKVRSDLKTVSSVTEWMITNIEAVYKHKTAVFAARQLVSTLCENIEHSTDVTWTQLLDKLVYKLIAGTNSRGRNHFLAAACSDSGSPLMIKLIRVSQHLSASVRTNFLNMISSSGKVLQADSNGRSVLKTRPGNSSANISNYRSHLDS